jgi:Na+-translocating ferredoxin:NAD+ oxidoreductase subunit D
MAEPGTSRAPGRLTVSPAPHLGVPTSTARMTWLVSLSLVPAAAWGVFLFGLPAAWVIATSICVAVIAELGSSALFRKFTLADGSALLTGLLVGLLMPAGVPLYVPAAAAAFGILVVKQSFGGLGRNWMNPALGGVVFALLSWNSAMTRWAAVGDAPASIVVVPPLDALRSVLSAPGAVGRPLEILASHGYVFSSLDGRIVSWLNTHILSLFHAALAGGSFDILVGYVPGRIGEVSAPLLLLGAAFLLWRRIVRWHVPVAYIATFAFLAWVFGGSAGGQGWFSGAPLFHVLSGSLILGAFFMAGDPVTSPLASNGKWIYGIGLGLLTFLLRFYGSLGDGVAVSIVLGNCAVPLIDKLVQNAPTRARRGIG